MIKKTLAFTVAEILVAMSIVGVVAAMTIPTLHYNKTKKEYSVKLKNFYSRMQNAIEDSQIDNGSFKDIKQPANNAASAWNWYLRYVDPYMGHQYLANPGSKGFYGVVYFKDGSTLQIANNGSCQDVVYDVNGEKSPNRPGYDKYRFLYCFTDASRAGFFGDKNIIFGTYGGGLVAASTTRQTMINSCGQSGSNSAWSCSRLLQVDNWEFKQDYPYKF